MISSSQFLRRALLADAIFSGAGALAMAPGATMLAALLDLPEALLLETGLFLFAYAALVGWLGTRASVPKLVVAIVIAGNAAWTLASIALLFSGSVSPNLLGEALRRGPGDWDRRPCRAAIYRAPPQWQRARSLSFGSIVLTTGRRESPRLRGGRACR